MITIDTLKTRRGLLTEQHQQLLANLNAVEGAQQLIDELVAGEEQQLATKRQSATTDTPADTTVPEPDILDPAAV